MDFKQKDNYFDKIQSARNWIQDMYDDMISGRVTTDEVKSSEHFDTLSEKDKNLLISIVSERNNKHKLI